MAGEDDGKQAELHKTYFHTQADIAKVEKALPRYEKMKLVADYDRLQADAHPGDKRLEAAASRSGKMAQTYYSNTIGGYVLARTDPDYRSEPERQGLKPLEPGRVDEWQADALANKAKKIHDQPLLEDRPFHGGISDPNTGKPVDPKAIEATRTQNNRDAVLDQVREAKQNTQMADGPARPEPAGVGGR